MRSITPAADLDAAIQSRIDAEASKFREKLLAEARAEAAAERARVAAVVAARPANDLAALMAPLMAKMEQLEQRLATTASVGATLAGGEQPAPRRQSGRVPSRPRKGHRSRARSTRDLPTEGEANVSDSYSGTALDDIRALLDLKQVVRIPDVIEANIHNHLGNPVTASNARRFLEKLEASKEAFCGKEFTRLVPGPGWRYVWAKTPELLAKAIAGKFPRAGEGRDGVNKA